MAATKVLYVEDEPFLAKIVKESLESRGYHVRLITTGGQAVQAFREYQPDVCILDVMLPQKDGFELAEEIRQQNTTVPILFVTAKNQTEDVLKGFRVGGNEYIRKPFSLEELIVRLENLLSLTQQRSSETPAVEQISIGHFTFSPTKMELSYRDEETRQLSYREVQIMELLCQHWNTTLDRRKLLLDVWGDDSFFNSRNLDVYIRKLRSYLARDERIQIITLKAVGYRFTVDEG